MQKAQLRAVKLKANHMLNTIFRVFNGKAYGYEVGRRPAAGACAVLFCTLNKGVNPSRAVRKGTVYAREASQPP